MPAANATSQLSSTPSGATRRRSIWLLGGLLYLITLGIALGAAGAQQLTLIISGGPVWAAPEAREVLAGVAGRPKHVVWTLSNSVAKLSFDRQRLANPPPGQPFKHNAVTVHCTRAGSTLLKAEPVDPSIAGETLNITCKSPSGGGGAGGGNPPGDEPHTFGWEQAVDQRAVDSFRLPAAGQARGRSIAEIVYAKYPGPFIRSDQGRCSGCHRAQYQNDHARSGGLVLENISRRDFCSLVPALVRNPRASFDRNVRDFFQDWYRRGCPD